MFQKRTSAYHRAWHDEKAKENLAFWLEEDIKKRTESHETYYNFGRIVKNHIIPILGKKKMSEVNRGDIQKLFNIKQAIQEQ